ncbi:MAG: DUF6448 family protein [Desulfobulbaceae bacterium]|nr:DUF6448 family protein [Desulfobulbaceae bacterium]
MRKKILFLAAVVGFMCTSLSPGRVQAHCDTVTGPVAVEAFQALESGDVTPLLKWVPKADEEAIRSAFNKARAVRLKGEDAAELADHYFLETLIRIHRAGEGAPYSGLKSGDDVDHAVKLADLALKDGDIDNLINILNGAMANGIRQRFKHTREAAKHAGDSVEAGRDYVASYVDFTHYVEGLHGIITGASGHGGGCKIGGGAGKPAEHGH